MKNVLLITSTIGIYAVLHDVWTWLEKIELGTAQVSFVDTVICVIISALISLFLMEFV